MIPILLILFSGISAVELENEGRLPEAGAVWQNQQNLQGQVRIICRMLEEAIYAGDGQRARLLIQELEPVCQDEALVEFWTARTAWISGLPTLAAEELDGIVSSDPWLNHRARGIAALYREQSGEAVEELLLSIASASTARRKFWSGIDLCSAYLNGGSYEEALFLSEMLVHNFEGDAMAAVMYGLCLQTSGRYSESFGVLSGIDSSNPAAEKMAEALMEGFEQ